jgi:hypothetical protein
VLTEGARKLYHGRHGARGRRVGQGWARQYNPSLYKKNFLIYVHVCRIVELGWCLQDTGREHAVTCCGLGQSVCWRAVGLGKTMKCLFHLHCVMKYCWIKWDECPSITLHANFVLHSPTSDTNVLCNSESHWAK